MENQDKNVTEETSWEDALACLEDTGDDYSTAISHDSAVVN